MGRYIILAILSFVSLFAWAMDDKPQFNGWGIRAAVDMNCPGDWKLGNGDDVKLYRNGFGFMVGGVYNLPLNGNLYFEPGVSLFYDTYCYDDLTVDGAGGQSVEMSPSVKKFGLRVPAVFGYRFFVSDRFGFSVYTGPELSYAFSDKVGLKTESDMEDLGDLLRQDVRRFDCAWKVGVGFPIGRWVVGVEGAFGLLDLGKGSVEFHENRVAVCVGYDF